MKFRKGDVIHYGCDECAWLVTGPDKATRLSGCDSDLEADVGSVRPLDRPGSLNPARLLYRRPAKRRATR